MRAFGGTVAVAAVGLAAGAGCTEEAPSTAQEQAVASGDWIRPNCNGDALTPGGSPTAVQCNGPVTYSYEETWANPACGAPTCSAYNTCTSWDLNAAGDGAGYTVASSSELGATWIYTNTLYGTVGPLPEDVCPSGAADRRAALAATRPGMSAAAAAAFDVTWAVANQQVVSEGGDPQGNDWFQNVAFTCQLDIHNFPTPMTGAHPWCGCAVSVQPTCARTGGTYAATSLPLAIPDNASAGAVATVVAPAGIDLKTVRVSLNVSHPRRADLVVSLISPGGQTAVLSNRVAGNGYVEVGRDVSSAFTAGASAGGVWQLRVQDLVAGNVGTINQLVHLWKFEDDADRHLDRHAADELAPRRLHGAHPRSLSEPPLARTRRTRRPCVRLWVRQRSKVISTSMPARRASPERGPLRQRR